MFILIGVGLWNVLVVGVAGEGAESFAIYISGVAEKSAGTVSMARGEYVSVSTRKDAQRKAIEAQTTNLDDN